MYFPFQIKMENLFHLQNDKLKMRKKPGVASEIDAK